MGNKIGKVIGIGTPTRIERQLELPTDILIDILSRLPVKDILRFRCICKLWCNILLDPYFENLHMSRASTSIMVTFQRFEYRWSSMLNIVESLDIGVASLFTKCPKASYFRLISSCNGLLVIQRGKDSYHVWNPATHKIIGIPNPPVTWKRMRLYHILSTSKYKLVCSCFEASKQRLAILTIGGRWRSPPETWGDWCGLAGDAPHLLRVDTSLNTSKILTFDVDSECLIENEPPNFPGDYLRTDYTEGWMGRMATIYYSEKAIEAFILEDYKRHKWVPKRIELMGKDTEELMLKNFPWITFHCLTHDGIFWFQSTLKRLISYNTESQEADYFYNIKVDGDTDLICPYVPTLVACDGM